MLGSAFFVTENLVKKTNKQTNKQKRKFSFVILPPPLPLLLTDIILLGPICLMFFFCSIDSDGGCDRNKCHVFASCEENPNTGKRECQCRLGFTGNGLNCEGNNGSFYYYFM